MKKVKAIAIATLIVLNLIQLASCQSNQNPKQKLEANEFEKQLLETKNAIILDVRTPEEYANGFISNAVNIDWNGNDFVTKVKELDKNKPLFVYCLSGGRSASAANKLAELGFNNIYELKGGINAWRNAEKPLTTTNKQITPKSEELSLEQYNQTIKNNKLVLVDFYAPWCGPCKIMAPYLQEIANENKDKLTFIKINSDKNQTIVSNQQVEELPTLLFYKNGKKVHTQIGLISKEDLLKLIKSL
jgi:thioredoxin